MLQCKNVEIDYVFVSPFVHAYIMDSAIEGIAGMQLLLNMLVANVIVVLVFDNVMPKCDCIVISVTVSVNII